jgi:hypothetical protein
MNDGVDMSKPVKTVVIGFVAVGAARRLAGWGIASAAMTLSAIQKSLENAAAPLPTTEAELPPRLKRDREVTDGLEVALQRREHTPVG